MSLCTDRTIVNEGPAEGTYATLKCKRWSCPECKMLNRRKVIERARDGNPNIFMTLTWNASRKETPDEAARVMKNAWVVLRRRMEKAFGLKKVPFIVVFERTKNGYPHMHMLLRSRYIKQQWLSEQMADLIDAPIVDIRAIKDRKHAFFYVTKYLGKDLAAFKGCKRWWRSHNYEIEKEEPLPRFTFGQRIEIVNINYYTMRAKILAGGASVIDERRGWMHFRRHIPSGFDPTYFGKVEIKRAPVAIQRKHRMPFVGDGWTDGR
jgi:hypothetical protein